MHGPFKRDTYRGTICSRLAFIRSAHYLREALSVWLSTGEEIHYAAEDGDILTAIGFRPDAASRVGNQEKYPPAQSLIYARQRTELASK
ncbi:phage polarity suppression protein [Raoultella terrigena]|uniref:phage polarity suppression protein n=1 Tax=Raoultella terrigena TaxID=577 RepID=UPI003F8D0582